MALGPGLLSSFRAGRLLFSCGVGILRENQLESPPDQARLRNHRALGKLFQLLGNFCRTEEGNLNAPGTLDQNIRLAPLCTSA